MNPAAARATLAQSSSRIASITGHLAHHTSSPSQHLLGAHHRLQAIGRVANMSTSKPVSEMPTFDKSTVGKNPLGEGKYVSTAGCLIIGDEVLNGKTKDSNSNYFARWCFNLGIDLRRVEVIPDEEEDIVFLSKSQILFACQARFVWCYYSML